MNWPRAFATWFFIAVAESIHGILRRIFILPVLGDLRAHQFGMLVGCLIIFTAAWACIRWIGARKFSEQLKVGAFWMVLMAIFGVLGGRNDKRENRDCFTREYYGNLAGTP